MDAENNNLRVASFSLYLNNSQEQNFVDKLTDQQSVERSSLEFTRRSPIISATGEKPNQASEIFGAEKYFNMKVGSDASPRMIDYNAAWRQQKKPSQVDLLHQTRLKLSRPQTPSVYSSESNWSSQGGALFPTLVRNSSQNKLKKVNEKWFFPGLSCRGSCSTKKPNHVDPNVVVQAAIQLQTDQNHHVMFSGGRRLLPQQRFMAKDEISCPSFDKMSIGSSSCTDASSYISMPIVSPRVQVKRDCRVEEPPRCSLEVFGSKDLKKGDIAKNLERKLSMLTWDAIPNAPNIPASTVSSLMDEEEAESEGSSDLFEIENLSGKPIMLTRQASDGKSSCTTPYAPSEASIDWSVTTGSALDYSAASDYYAHTIRSPGYLTSPKIGGSRFKPAVGDTTTQRGKSSSRILGCNSQKAIQVAEPQPQRSTAKKFA